MECRRWSSGNPADKGLGFSGKPWLSFDPVPSKLSALREADGGSVGRGEEVLERES